MGLHVWLPRNPGTHLELDIQESASTKVSAHPLQSLLKVSLIPTHLHCDLSRQATSSWSAGHLMNYLSC